MTGCLLLPAAPFATAQTTTADITGTVTDTSGAAIPNATVTITNLGTQEKQTAQSSGAGDYTFTQLGPGNYSIQVTEKGFKSFLIPSLSLSAADRAREDAKLEIGSEAQTVQVTGQAPVLQTDTSSLSTTITEKAVQDLPLNGRNYVTLAQITPGANAGPPNGLSSGARPDDRRQTSSISLNGQSDVINDYLIDGLDNTERIIGTSGVRPSIEAIREINIQTNDYTADVGRTAGGVINIITKSGTNNFHGSAYEFFQNDVLNANPFQFGATNPKPKLRYNLFGGSIGGPIIKDKTFFFADYEGQREIEGANPTVSQVPTLAQYNALRSDPASLADGGAVDPVGLDYALLYPAPNAASTVFNSAGVATSGAYVSSPVQVHNSDVLDARVDEQFSPKDLLYGRYSYNRVPSDFPGLLPITNEAGLNIAPGGANYNFYGAAKDDAQDAQINYVHTFSANVLLQLGFGYTRINNQSFPLNYGEAVNTAFGQPNVNLSQLTSGLSPAGVTGLADIGDGSYIPIEDVDDTYQEEGSVTINRGAQNIRIGAALIRRQALNFQNNQGIGDWGFNPLGSDPTGLGALLQGDFANVQRSNSLDPPHYRVWEPSGYVQDDWRAASNLTLNLGVRYDVFTPFTEAHNAISNFNPATDSIDVAGVNGVNDHAGLKTNYSDVAPRIGFALTALPGLVIRGGYGISYIPENYTSNASLKNQPFVSAYQCNNGACPTPTAATGGPGNGTDQFHLGVPLPAAASATNPTGNIADVVSPNFRPSSLQQFNLTLEKEVSGNVIQMSYVGLLGRHLAEIYNDQNTAPLISNIALDLLALQNGETPAAAYNSLRPYSKGNLSAVTSIGGYNSEGSSSYNALQLVFTRRTRAGLTINANYTLAHGLDDILGISNEVNDGYGAVPSQISTVEYGNSDVDIRQRGVVAGDYELPFGKNLTGIAGALGKGWQANTILQWETGEPFTVSLSQSVADTVSSSTAGRPNQIGNAKVSNKNIAEFFNPAAFQPQASGTLGTESKNPLYGPHFRDVDFSVFKTFPVYRETTVEFRAECFNIVNTANFANPNATLSVSPSTFPASYAGDGAAAGTNVQLPTNDYAVQASTLGSITGTSGNYNPRKFQFALKYQF
jgi:hypothetical protein